VPMSLLTDNQQRRLGTHLRLLIDDLERLEELPELGTEGAAGRVRHLLEEARRAALGVRDRMALPPDRGPALHRRVAAAAEVWAVRVEDLRVSRLRAYGDVHPDLAATLDPLLDQLRRILLALADAASELPDR
jgi:hypothetical protein